MSQWGNVSRCQTTCRRDTCRGQNGVQFLRNRLEKRSQHLHFASLGSNVGKGVQDMGQLVGGEVLGVMVASVDRLVVHR